jgi:hypothetical protein
MRHFTRTANERSGVSLVMVTFVVSVLATLSASMVMVTNSVTKEKLADRQKIGALFAAEAGVSEAVFALNNGQSGVVGSSSKPISQSGSNYWVQETVLPSGMRTLVSTGTDNASGVRVEVTVELIPNNIWAWGAFGDDALSLDQNSHVDSYDSRLGDYLSQQVNGSGNTAYASSNGHVGSNGDIGLLMNSSVKGNAICGPSSTTTVTGNATVSGSTAPSPELVVLPELEMPSFGSLGNFLLPANSSGTIPSGNWEYDDFDIDQQSKLTIVGPAQIVVQDFEMFSQSAIVVDASAGPVQFYVWDDFIMNSNTEIASTSYEPQDVLIALNSDNIVNPTQTVQLSEVTFESNSVIYGMFFAPNASVRIDSNFELYGSLVGREVHLDSWARVHFDEALLDADVFGNDPYWAAVCWRKMPYKTMKGANAYP